MRIQIIQDTIDKIRKKDIRKEKEVDTIFYVIKALKEYGIKNIIASPGMQNASFNFMAQKDSFFNCISVVDERSAAYVATGLSFESNEPTVITCTGATASRNYFPGMTEAYYRKIPIVALTFHNTAANEYNLEPQFIDRSVSSNDVKAVHVKLPDTSFKSNISECIVKLHVALMTAKYLMQPVHIDCPSAFTFENDEISNTLPISRVGYFNENLNINLLKNDMKGKKIAIYIGSKVHDSDNLENAISQFAINYKCPVFCDHTSNYHGKNKVLISQAVAMSNLIERPDIVIDIGQVSGSYDSNRIFEKSCIWRVSSSQKIKMRFSKPLKYYFNCTEFFFFDAFNKGEILETNDYNSIVQDKINKLSFPDLPLSNILVCQHLSTLLPKNCSLNVSILNSLRSLNFFKIDESIKVNCNVGGFGMDGAVSSFIGMSLSNTKKKYFGLFGDLAFFYDMNILGNRDISSNIRIIVINNGSGEEFHLIKEIESTIGECETNRLIAAGGHNKNGIKAWAECNNFIYDSISIKEELYEKLKFFCQADTSSPMLLEVKVSNIDEIQALQLITTHNNYVGS